MTTAPPPRIHVVDDDAHFLRSLLFMVEGLGFDAVGHPSAEAFAQAAPAPVPQGSCLLLDIRMPRMSGLELQRRLQGQPGMPIVFMTGHGDVDQAVQALRGGAVDFLQKPFREQALLDALNRAVAASVQAQQRQARQAQALAVLQRLTPRERDVARLLALGHSNKEVARRLDISDHTVHVHRQGITKKTGSGHAADLARLILRAAPQELEDDGAGPS